MTEIKVSGALKVKGTIELSDMNEALDAKSGSSLIVIPAFIRQYLAATLSMSLDEEDGGVLFENGVWVEDVKGIYDPPIGDDGYSMTVYYVG
jgi:hypothetical protein